MARRRQLPDEHDWGAAMSNPPYTDHTRWTSALRDAIAARDEAEYRRTLMQYLATHQGVLFADTLMKKPAALAVMRRSFAALALPLGIASPSELVGWLRADEARPITPVAGSMDVVAAALPYFRFARSWSRAARKDDSYAVALALMFFEPVVALCDAPILASRAAPTSVTHAAAAPATGRSLVPAPALARDTTPSFARITERA
jgi:hypothetical protein